jgi:hypothetical protein
MKKKDILVKVATTEWKSNIKLFKNRPHQLESSFRPGLPQPKEQQDVKTENNFTKLPQWE